MKTRLQFAFQKLQKSFKKQGLSPIYGDEFSFTSSSLCEAYQNRTHDIRIERSLRTILDLNCCVSSLGKNLNQLGENQFRLERFTLEETPERFEYFYHSTDVSPDIILEKGLLPQYSLRTSKPFGPLIFLSNGKKHWIGKYLYKVKVRQKVYFDTNLNWRRKTGHWAFCVRNRIPPDNISLYLD